MTKPQPITYDGVDYPSLTALSKKYGLTISSVRIRLRDGKPLDTPKLSASEAGRMGKAASGWGDNFNIKIGE